MKNLLNKSFASGSVAVALLLLAGCTTPAQPTNMAATEVSGLGVTFPGSVAVDAGQRDYDKKAGMAQIGDSELRAAIQASLEKSGLFEQVVEVGGSDYLVYAAINSLKQPLVGMAMTVSLSADWKLIDARTNKTLWHDSISTEYKAGVGDALAGATRVRLATEGAVRENIEQALVAISKVSL